jgi:hypothetical protein
MLCSIGQRSGPSEISHLRFLSVLPVIHAPFSVVSGSNIHSVRYRKPSMQNGNVFDSIIGLRPYHSMDIKRVFFAAHSGTYEVAYEK